MLGRSPGATKMMASRARRRVRGAVPAQDADKARQRTVVDAFLAAARGSDFEALVAVLDPDVVLRTDTAAGPVLAGGARDVAGRASIFARLAAHVRPVLVNGVPGVLAATADERADGGHGVHSRSGHHRRDRQHRRPRAPRRAEPPLRGLSGWLTSPACAPS